MFISVQLLLDSKTFFIFTHYINEERTETTKANSKHS